MANTDLTEQTLIKSKFGKKNAENSFVFLKCRILNANLKF